MNKPSLAKIIWVFIALSGGFSVLFGAWLAHAGQGLIESDKARLITAHHYQIIHTLALLALSVAYRMKPATALLVSSLLFIAGIIAFSGSLYFKTLLGVSNFTGLAPFGGLTLAIGWFSLAFVGKEKL